MGKMGHVVEGALNGWRRGGDSDPSLPRRCQTQIHAEGGKIQEAFAGFCLCCPLVLFSHNVAGLFMQQSCP